MTQIFSDLESAAALVDGLKLIEAKDERRTQPRGDIVFYFAVDNEHVKELRFLRQNGFWQVKDLTR